MNQRFNKASAIIGGWLNLKDKKKFEEIPKRNNQKQEG